MNKLIEFCSKFGIEHISMMLVMLILGLILGYVVWHRDSKTLQEMTEAKERAENYATERERVLEEMRKQQIEES